MSGQNTTWITFSKAVAVVGICKNAGKTTLLNHIIESHPGHRWGVMSTGIDGEETDKVYGHRKPALRLPCGTIFICDTPTLNSLGSSIVILTRLVHSGRRKLWVVRALEDVQTSITGPGNVREQAKCVATFTRYGAQTTLIDGSFDRKSIAQSAVVEGVILAVGAGFGSIDEIITELHRIFALTKIPVLQISPIIRDQINEGTSLRVCRKSRWKDTGIASLIGDNTELDAFLAAQMAVDKLYIPGAITDSGLDYLLSLRTKLSDGIVVRHPDCIKLSPERLCQLCESIPVRTLYPMVIKGISLNPWAVGVLPVDAAEFRNRIRAEFPERDFVDIMEIK